MIRIIIVDDHASVRDSFRAAMADCGDMQVLGDSADASTAELLCEKLQPDLVLMDVCTAGGASGLAATKRIKERFPAIKVVVMTGFDEVTYLPRARECGADAFVENSMSLSFFLQLIRDVAGGEQVFPQQKRIPVQPGELPLTAREMEVLRMACDGRSYEEIAAALCISKNTVSHHIQSITGKMGFERTFELVSYVIRNGWLNPNF